MREINPVVLFNGDGPMQLGVVLGQQEPDVVAEVPAPEAPKETPTPKAAAGKA